MCNYSVDISHVLCFVSSAVYWTGYELLRARFAEPGFMASFSSGVLSGAVSTFYCTTCSFHNSLSFPQISVGKHAKHVSKCDVQATLPGAASSVGVRRQDKRKTALISYKDLDASLTGRINDTPGFICQSIEAISGNIR